MAAAAAAERPAGLAGLATWASPAEAAAVEMLLREGQAHLFAAWVAGEATEKKHAFCTQVAALERGYPGGVAAYLANARALLRDSAAGANPFEGMRPEVPAGVKLEYGTPEFVAAEEAGVRIFRDCAFVLVAGGLGERLGYTDIKVSLPVETTTGTPYLALYIRHILALQAFSNRMAGGPPRTVPLVIMTSDDTHAKTVALLEGAGNFGAAEGQVTILKQEKVAALVDNDAHIATEEGDAMVIDTKPHGHGDVHTLLASSGMAAAWAAEGRRYVVFFQDTNSLCFSVTQATLGVSEAHGFEVNSVTVARKAKDAVGAITKLVKADGSAITINVEYNQLEPLLKASGFADGDVNDASGYSPYPGNINQLVLAIPPYAAVLARTGGLVPEFVNPKYADATKTRFKKPTRLECMMQDHPKLLGATAKVGFTNFPEWTYSPVKNSVDEARAKIAVGVPGRCAAEGELEYYDGACRQLAAAGVTIPAPGTWVGGAHTRFRLRSSHTLTHPHNHAQARWRCLASSCATRRTWCCTPPLPSAAPACAATCRRRRTCTSRRAPRWWWRARACASTRWTWTARWSSRRRRAPLWVCTRCAHACHPTPLTLYHHTTPRRAADIKNVREVNAGWELVPLATDEVVPAAIKIRGFKLVKHAARVLEFPTPGRYVVDDSAAAAAH